MKKLLKYLKVSTIILSATGMLLTMSNVPVRAEKTVPEDDIVQVEGTEIEDNVQLNELKRQARYLNANIDIVDGRQVRMPMTNLGVVVDGYQLNHDYVKILNINNGNITIFDENFTQDSVNEPWTTQEDAYVIKGQGTSTNSITITPTKNEITLYLVDLEWSGQIIINGNDTKVNLVVCGSVTNKNATCTVYVSRQTGSINIAGLNGRQDVITSNSFLYNHYSSYYTFPRIMTIKDVTINANSFITNNGGNSYYDASLELDNVALNNNGNFYGYAYKTINVKNSILDKIEFRIIELTSTDSVINFKSPVNGNFNSTNSVLTFTGQVTGQLFSTNSTLALNSLTASNFSKINLENTSLFSAVNFVGTPVDKDANDLYVKKIRLRQFPTAIVYVSINNGPEARLQTDANGYLYPFVKKGTTRIDVRLEGGRTYYATFPATTGTDNSTTNLIQSAESSPVIVTCSSAQNITVGESLLLSVVATPGTAGKSLSYQWYKDNVLLSGETKATLTKNEAVTNDSGSYKCTVKEDGGGTITSENIEVVVSKATSLNSPVIKNMTSDMNLIVGSSITLTINAEPSVATNWLSYQWYFNNTKIGTDSPKLMISKIKPNEAGSYKCVITEENFNTTTETGEIKITVSNPS